MEVFTDEWIEHIRKRYNRGPDYRKLRIYYIATRPKNQSVRDEVEACVANLTLTNPTKVIADLRSSTSFFQTYHELVVGNLLSRFGYEPEHSKEVADLTPDWYVPSKGYDVQTRHNLLYLKPHHLDRGCERIARQPRCDVLPRKARCKPWCCPRTVRCSCRHPLRLRAEQ